MSDIFYRKNKYSFSNQIRTFIIHYMKGKAKIIHEIDQAWWLTINKKKVFDHEKIIDHNNKSSLNWSEGLILFKVG
jgi:hypothetical protein